VWTPVWETLKRPYRVTVPMVILVSIVPLYLFIPDLTPDRTPHVPEIALDRAIPVQPVWSLIYGALYMFLIVLPVLAVRQEEHIRRTVLAYLTVWLTAYVCFVLYPTVASRPEQVIGDGFAAWGLRALYDSDPPYNCFPSIHVAHSFVSALTVYRLHRATGIFAAVCAALVAVSTLYTKQHYVVDVIAGIALAFAAYLLFLRSYRREEIPALDRQLAPGVAAATLGVVGLGVVCFWGVYRLTA
jgi:membrane-associated phospholipid phosphatase